jgi:hypothetical protein
VFRVRLRTTHRLSGHYTLVQNRLEETILGATFLPDDSKAIAAGPMRPKPVTILTWIMAARCKMPRRSDHSDAVQKPTQATFAFASAISCLISQLCFLTQHQTRCGSHSAHNLVCSFDRYVA